MKIVSDTTLFAKPGAPIAPGTPVDVPKAEAASLIARGLARAWHAPKSARPVPVDADTGAADDGDAVEKAAPEDDNGASG